MEPTTNTDPVAAADNAIRIAGGGAKLAKAIGVTRFAVQQWKATGIPIKRVVSVAEATKLSLHEVRPDVFAKGAA